MGRTTAKQRRLLVSVWFFLYFFFILLLPARAQVDFYHKPYPPVDLTSGWQYHWGISSLNSLRSALRSSPQSTHGMPLWVQDNLDRRLWKRFAAPGQPPGSHNLNNIWVRIKLPPRAGPRNHWDDPGLLFSTSDQVFRVFLDGKEIYQYGEFQGEKRKPPGSPWHIIPLPGHYENKTLMFQMHTSSVRMGSIIRLARLGSRSDLLIGVIRDSIDYLLLAGLFIFLGFGLMVIFAWGSPDQKSFIILGFSSTCAGLWLVSETSMRQLLFDLPVYYWTYLAIGSFYLMPVGFCAFVEQIFGGRHRFILRKLWQSYLLFDSIAFLLDLCGLIPLAATLSIFYILLAITIVILVAVVIQAALKGNVEARIISAGITVFSLTGFYDILGWYFQLVPWKRYLTHWGLFIFILFLVYLLRNRYLRLYQQLSGYSNEIKTKNEDLQQMWLEVKESRDQIEQWNKTLELRVIERTEQLEKANREFQTTLDTLRKTQARLIQSEKMSALGSLVAGVAHEINTPIGISVTAVSHLMQKSEEAGELFRTNRLKRSDLAKYFELSREMSQSTLVNLDRAAGLIKGFKEVAVDQSSEIKRRFKVKEYIGEVLLSLRPQLKKTPHCITVTCPDDLEIDSYPGAFSQIITNLVMNSLLHAFDEPDSAGAITFAVTRREKTLMFDYSDNGVGIDPEIRDRIFDPFFTTKRGQGGTGLGLHLIYNIVTQTLNGAIECYSQPGKGTTFTITFPV